MKLGILSVNSGRPVRGRWSADHQEVAGLGVQRRAGTPGPCRRPAPHTRDPESEKVA